MFFISLVQDCFDHRIGDLFDTRKLANSQSKSPCCDFLLYGSFILMSVDLNLEMFQYVSTCFTGVQAYTILPDNVWRPLVLGEVSSPTAIAVDPLSSRLFVADPPKKIIWWYQLGLTNAGFLQTTGKQRAAVEGFSAHWLAVNGAGNLYFSGHPASKNGSLADSIWRIDNEQIVNGDTFNPTEIYTRANTGQPDPKVWELSGLAVDSFYIFWGNQAGGTKHGSVSKGTRANIGLQSQDMLLSSIGRLFLAIFTSTCNTDFFLGLKQLETSSRLNRNRST